MALDISRMYIVLMVGLCMAVVRACPSPCSCTAYPNRPSDLMVDCSGLGLQSIPTPLPSNTRGLNLANNLISTINPGAISNTDLVEINLSGNRLQQIPSRSFNIRGDCDLEAFVFLDYKHVNNGHWTIMDLTEVRWPCLIDLRNNPISTIQDGAFGGSYNISLFLGDSTTNLAIEANAFSDTNNVIGVHISGIPSLTLAAGSFDGMDSVGWIVVDQTEIPNLPRLVTSGHGTHPRWIRISKTTIQAISSNALAMTMDVETTCYVRTYPYRSQGMLTTSTATIFKGGIELINNTLPVLPEGLLKDSLLGGIYFNGNRIAGMQAGSFARSPTASEVCLIRFTDNDLNVVPKGAFRELHHVVHFSISGTKLNSIEKEAFADSSDIGSFGVSFKENKDMAQATIRAKAFTKIHNVGIFSVSGIDKRREQGFSPQLIIEPYAFDGLRNVEYMAVNLYENMPELPDNLFTGLTVNQQFIFRPRNLTRINAEAFGRKQYSTSIKRLEVEYLQNFPCDCETAQLNANMKVTVEEIFGLTCTAPLDDGSISHAWNLDHAVCSACRLQCSLLFIICISLFFNW